MIAYIGVSYYNMVMKKSLYARLLEPLARLIFPKCKLVTKQEIPDDEPAVFLCNHSAAIGPAIMTMYFEIPHKTWSISYALDKKIGPTFFFHDALFGRSKKCKWFYKFVAHITMPLLRPLLWLGNPIAVYHDKRILSTMRASVDALEKNEKIVIFPECPTRYTEYINAFYDGFADLGRLYNVKTGKCLKFYPVYVEKKNRIISIGEPVVYDPNVPARDQRRIIAEEAAKRVDALARELPAHKPVPFLPQVWYDYYGEYENNITEYWRMIEQTSPYMIRKKKKEERKKEKTHD